MDVDKRTKHAADNMKGDLPEFDPKEHSDALVNSHVSADGSRIIPHVLPDEDYPCPDGITPAKWASKSPDHKAAYLNSINRKGGPE